VKTADRLSGSADAQPPSSWWARHGLALFLGALAAFAGVVILIVVGPSGLVGFAPRSSPVAVPASRYGLDTVVEHIYDVTNQAFQQRRLDLLNEVYDPHCQCYQQARQVIDSLLAAHQVLGGSGTKVVGATVLKIGPDVALLKVTDKVDPFPVYDEQGRVVAQQPGRVATSFTFTLSRHEGQWLLTDVVPQGGSLP
jgi:hypothetical protein